MKTNKLILFIILATVTSCGKGKIKIKLSDLEINTPENVSASLTAPNALSLSLPSSSPGYDSTPTIQVDGVESGDTVKVYSDASCSIEVGSSVSSGTSVDVTLNALDEITYTLYATTTRSSTESSCSSASVAYQYTACPTGYIPVPGNSGLGTDDFCVMQYEAKAWNDANTNSTIDGGEVDTDGLSVTLGTHVPVSIANNQPWRSINANDATAECESLGANYHLISNPEWMTIARNAENIDANWTGGTVGNGCMFRGNSGDTTCGYNSATDPDSGSSRNARAILTLSNGEQIYDFAGNVYEWTDWDKDTAGFQTGPTSCSTVWTELPSVACGALASSDYDTANGTYTSIQGVGQLYGGAGGAALRGGYWLNATGAGAFTLLLSRSPTSSFAFFGFRCVWRP